MDLKLDENLPAEMADLLREAGHNAANVLEQSLGGTPDQKLAAAVADEGRVLVTLDTDFADIRAHPPEATPGIIVMRLRRQDKQHILDVARQLLLVLADESPARSLWIVEESRIRIRAPQRGGG